jgi:hypothetical protein
VTLPIPRNLPQPSPHLRDIAPQIGKTAQVRRTLAGLLFGFAYLSAAIAVSGFLLQRTAFDPERTADLADVVMEDSAIRSTLSNVIADATAESLGATDKQTVRDLVAQVALTPGGAALFAEVLHDSHAHLIGEQKDPVRITGQQMVQIVRNEAVGNLPPIVLPVPKVWALDLLRRILDFLVPIAAVAAIGLAIVGFSTHPERGVLFRSLGFGLILLAVLVAVLGYLIPRFAVPALNDSAWARVPARLADDSLPLIVAVVLLLVGGGLALLAGSGMLQRRRRWSSPVSTYRYSEERRWG